MSGTVGDQGVVTVVERSLQHALAATASAVLTDLPVADACVPALSWDALPFGQEGKLPAAVVTWRGHAPVVSEPVVTAAAAAGPADADSDLDAAASVADADGDLDGGASVAGAAGGVVVGGRSAAAASDAARSAAGGSDAAGSDAAGLDDLPVGGGLVDALCGLDVTAVDDAELLDVAARWQEVISWAIASQSRALGEIGRRRAWTEEHNAAAAEISARLRVPQGEANKHLARGAGLAEHPPVLHALRRGLIDVAKADILLRSGNPLTTEERAEAIALYLPQAPERTRRWLREKMNEFANELKGTTETTKHARSRRAVFLDPADNSMAWLSANLPATDAAAVWDAVEQAAHTLRRAPGGTRTLAQARADALVAITTGRIIVPPHPECAPEPAGAELGGIETTGSTGTGGSNVDSGVESCVESADEPALPRTTVPATGCTCEGCTCGGTTIRVVPVKPQIRITIAATTLLGLDNTPGHLHGYGPIPADTAAQIASDATWQRLLTDPVTGILTDYSTTTYQPGKLLRQAVTTRDQTCTFPQCDRPAHFADLDHIVPFDHTLDLTTQPPGTPGQTRATNLQPLCRAHHLAKTHHGWTPVRDPTTGITTWTAPTGHVYTRPATQTGHVSNDTTSLIDDTRARLGQPPLTEPLTTNSQNAGSESTDGPSSHDPSTEQPSTEQQLRRYPDQPPF